MSQFGNECDDEVKTMSGVNLLPGRSQNAVYPRLRTPPVCKQNIHMVGQHGQIEYAVLFVMPEPGPMCTWARNAADILYVQRAASFDPAVHRQCTLIDVFKMASWM